MSPLVVADGIAVFEHRRFAGIDRVPAVLVLEQQPQFFEGVSVVLDAPADRLTVDLCVKVDLLPGQRIHAVELVRPLGVAGIAIDGYPDEVSGNGPAGRIEQLAPLTSAVHVRVVDQLGVVVLNDQA